MDDKNRQPEFGYDPKEDCWNVPSIDVVTNIGHTALTWLNTKIMTFGIPSYNHVEFVDYDGELGEEGKVYGMNLDVDQIGRLQELQFPEDFRPIPDESTEQWWVQMLDDDISDSSD